jgi:lipoate-protein ligase A
VGEAAILGLSDIGQGDRKFSGSAQRRLRKYLLYHGTVLYRFPIELLARYLRPPRRQPAYRRQRDHAEFVINVPADPESLKAALRSAWHADLPLADWPAARTAELAATKYEAQEWIRRR